MLPFNPLLDSRTVPLVTASRAHAPSCSPVPSVPRPLGPCTMEVVADNKLILITLLVKLGVAAAVASALARSRTFQRLLFAEHRSRLQTVALLAFFLIPLALG